MAGTEVVNNTGGFSDVTAPSNDAGGAVAPASAEPKNYNFGGKTYNSVDDLGKAYESAQQELGKWTQQYGDLRRQYDTAAPQAAQAEKWNKWWETVAPVWGEDVEKFLQQKMMQGGRAGAQAAQTLGQMQQNVANGQDPFEGFEMLPVREQFQRFGTHIQAQQQEVYTQRLAELARAVNDTFQQREQYYNNYLSNHLGLLRKALEEKFRNPNFDIDKTMEMAAQAIGGQIDPIQLGQQLINASTFQAQLETAKKAAYEQGKKDFEQEQANKKQEAVPMSFSAPKFKYTQPANQRQGLSSLRQTAAENMAKIMGPQAFAPKF